MTLTMQIKNESQGKTHQSAKFTYAEQSRLRNKLTRIYINEELVDFIQVYIKKLSKKDQLNCLIWFERTVAQTYRSPDPRHFAAFEDLYNNELVMIAEKQKFFEPTKWLQAEIKYVTNSIERLTSEDVDRKLDIMQEAKQKLSKDWLTFKEVMQLFGISKSTLNRRIANGMPCHKNGKPTYFFLNEINEYMKSEA